MAGSVRFFVLRLRARGRRADLALVTVGVVLGASLLIAQAPAAAAETGSERLRARSAVSPPPRFSPPVPGEVLRQFSAPRARYGPGHRGVDFEARPGRPARAVGDGRVVFAASVAGSLHVVVAHAGNLRTSYSYLASIDVRKGARVARGDPVGTVGGAPPGGSTGVGAHGAGGLHLGARVGETYIDPMLLFQPPDLTEIVHLAPVGEPDRGRDRSWAIEASGLSAGLDSVAMQVATDVTIDGPTGGAPHQGRSGSVGGSLASWFTSAARVVPGGGAVSDVVGRLGAAARAQLECDRDAPAADGTGGSGHHLLAVAGINSSTNAATGATFGLAVADLGYYPDEIDWFSYAGGGRAYTAEDTHQRIVASARELARQLGRLQAANPGREVDLIAHSQGGVVIDVFLQHIYDASDSRYPPIGTVITLSSPHQGAPAAEAARRIAQSDAGRAALGLGGSAVPPADAPAVADLDPRSDLMDNLWDDALPDQVDLTSIAAVDDPIVPATRTEVAGADHVVVDPAGVMDHTPIVSDAHAMTAVRSALEGRSPPCLSAGDAIRGAIGPVIVTNLESAVGRAGEVAGRAADAVGDLAETGADAADKVLDAVGLGGLVAGWQS